MDEQNNFVDDRINFDEYFNELIQPIQDDGHRVAFKGERMYHHHYNPNTMGMGMGMGMEQIPKLISNVHNNNKKRNHLDAPSMPEEEEEMPLMQEEKKPVKKPKKAAAAKNANNKKKKDTPKRKRVNYCFEIHRSGCQQNKESKLYCKVFLKGKLQSEVDLIKGARGKWAYTFYDQRKKKKERRYWPSQSSGPVIEDSCKCDKCTGTQSSVYEEEVDFSSPSTEEATLIEYENCISNSNPNISQHIDYHHVVPQYPEHQQHFHQQQSQHHNHNMHNNYYFAKVHNNIPMQHMHEMHEMNVPQYIYNTNKNGVNLKSSNDFQDNISQQPHYVLKSSNDFMNHQRPWDNYFPNNMEYVQDGLFVDNSFL